MFRSRSIIPGAPDAGLAEILEGGQAVAHRVDPVGHPDILQGSLHRHRVHSVVFNEQYRYVRLHSDSRSKVSLLYLIVSDGYSFGRVKKKVDPLPTSDSIHTFPPCISTIFFTSVSPMPVLSMSSLGEMV